MCESVKKFMCNTINSHHNLCVKLLLKITKKSNKKKLLKMHIYSLIHSKKHSFTEEKSSLILTNLLLTNRYRAFIDFEFKIITF